MGWSPQDHRYNAVRKPSTRERAMPEVYVHAVKGRTQEQKRALVKDITDAEVKNFNAPAEAGVVSIIETEATSKSKGGVLFSEMKRCPWRLQSCDPPPSLGAGLSPAQCFPASTRLSALQPAVFASSRLAELALEPVVAPLHDPAVIPGEYRPQHRRAQSHPWFGHGDDPLMADQRPAIYRSQRAGAGPGELAVGLPLDQRERLDAQRAHLDRDRVGQRRAPGEAAQGSDPGCIARLENLHSFDRAPPGGPLLRHDQRGPHRNRRGREGPVRHQMELRGRHDGEDTASPWSGKRPPGATYPLRRLGHLMYPCAAAERARSIGRT